VGTSENEDCKYEIMKTGTGNSPFIDISRPFSNFKFSKLKFSSFWLIGTDAGVRFENFPPSACVLIIFDMFKVLYTEEERRQH
jgi:hypothetical protein